MSVMMTPDRLAELTERFAAARIVVVGDFFLDRYFDIDPALEEISVETGLPAHQVVSVRSTPGAAGTVVANLASLGTGRLHAVGFSGEDGEGWELRRGLNRLGCSDEHFHLCPERFTPTYLKPRDRTQPGLAGEHSRIDTKNRQPTPEDIQRHIQESLSRLAGDADAVVVMDQVESPECGAVTTAVRNRLAELAVEHPNVIFWADSRRRIRQYRNVIIKPNEFEAVGNDDPRPGDSVDVAAVEAAARSLRRQTQAPVFVTRGAAGMYVTDPDWTAVPGVRVSGETDTTGAGDSATAGCVLALCAGATCPEAALIGNLVASITVQQLATTGTARPEQLVDRLQMWRDQNT